ncbi:MAG: hypothetical protein J6A26_04985, partial [Oscillospiraceae bacterium]|nr:hypothetical protein [Oscillospiraceae bacterium]
MMKKISLLVASALLLLTFSACHGSRGLDAFVIPKEFDTSRDYEITFWAKNDTNKTQTEIYQKAIDDFEELYPNITVNLRLYTDYGRIYNDDHLSNYSYQKLAQLQEALSLLFH